MHNKFFIRLIVVFLTLLALSSCHRSGGASKALPSNTVGSHWDQMVWDQDSWN
jgi:hypothetical protein